MTDSADILPGVFRVYAATMPDEAERVVATVTEQVRAMRSGAFGDDEVNRARQYLGRRLGLRLPDRRAACRAAARTGAVGTLPRRSRRIGPSGSRR